MEPLIEVRDLTRRFGPVTAVEGVSFDVARGEVLGFLGPNGAGKTTTMRMVTGYLPPTSGSVRVCGLDVAERPIAAKRRIGFLPEGAPAYGDMTPAGLLGFVAALHGLTRADKARRVAEAIERLELASVVERPIETLSKGYRRRVGLAQAILLDPEVLILDEPTDGLDPNQKHHVRVLLNQMARDKAIVVSTHILEEVEAVCTRAIVIAGGRIVADETPAALQARSRYHNAISLRLPEAEAEAARDLIGGIAGVARVEREQETRAGFNGTAHLVAFPRPGSEILAEVRDALGEARLGAGEIYLERGRLDEVFRRLTAPEQAGEQKGA